jgi:hypothetical protein
VEPAVATRIADPISGARLRATRCANMSDRDPIPAAPASSGVEQYLYLSF